MLHRPKKRSCPSSSSSRRANVRFQPPGEMNGKSPSMTSTRAHADQSASQSKLRPPYFLPGAAAPAEPPPRKALKNSELDGSMIITSPFLPKLAMYACRLR